ncbi:MAG: phosphatase PAP2 family protein [Candidatus Magasanikbacteria bacterium]
MWSQKLFLKINSQLGKRIWLDKLMAFIARPLIYILFFCIICWGIITLDPNDFKFLLKLIITTLVFAILFSWLTALIVRFHRPMAEMPKIKFLVRPYQTWKTFPSDHTLISFSLVLIAIDVGAGWILGSLFFLVAILIAFSRVYVGVHYPRDILAGIIYAIVFSSLAYWLLENISQPVYDFFFTMSSRA